MNLPITHLAIVCIVVSSDGREKGKDWASYHPYHRYLIKNFGCFLSLTLGFVVVAFFFFDKHEVIGTCKSKHWCLALCPKFLLDFPVCSEFHNE